MRHVSWVGIASLIYVALQARAVLAQRRRGVAHSLMEILVSLQGHGHAVHRRRAGHRLGLGKRVMS
jgi:hypothetical protein